jgi:hypothetical protein
MSKARELTKKVATNKNIVEKIKACLDQNQDGNDPVLQYAIRMEAIVQDTERVVRAHIDRIPGNRTSFESLLSDIRQKHRFNDAEVAEEIEIARSAWIDLANEYRDNPVGRESFSSRGRRISLKFGCKACKLTVSATFVAAGGIGGVVAAYSAGTAAPAYFVALAGALSISVTALYAILGAAVAGTISVSSIPREICRKRRKC